MRLVSLGVYVAVALAFSAPAPRSGPDLPRALSRLQQFRGAIDLVPIYATVTDARGALVTNLDRASFAVHDEGPPQTISFFEAGVEPITMAILVDRSPSLFKDSVRIQNGIAAFTRSFVAGDRACLGFFSHVVTLDPTLTTDARELLKHFGDAAPLPAGTALWDALNTARSALSGEGGRRVILVITDGVDNCSRADVESVRTALGRDGLLLYVIGVHGSAGLLSADLATLARTTGGWYFELSSRDDLNATMQRVADELHRQYILAFRPTRLDGKVHRLDVRVVSRRGLVVRARRFYVASSEVRAH